MEHDFIPFDKLARLSRDITITEKLDGTNASIAIFSANETHPKQICKWTSYAHGELQMVAGSRTRWITPADDNFGFAAWVYDNLEELSDLGPGRHFGEWWGQGIQRKYGLDHRRFSLFNTGRWARHDEELVPIPQADPRAEPKFKQRPPACCDVVPTLYTGPFCTNSIDSVLHHLASIGSAAAPGFTNPEGIVVYHTAAGVSFKKTIDHDGLPKSLAPKH